VALTARTPFGRLRNHRADRRRRHGVRIRARDTKLNRDVALKILPDALARAGSAVPVHRRSAGPASLKHPNIARIDGLEEYGGALALYEAIGMSISARRTSARLAAL
jgi:hypothetical protein